MSTCGVPGGRTPEYVFLVARPRFSCGSWARTTCSEQAGRATRRSPGARENGEEPGGENAAKPLKTMARLPRLERGAYGLEVKHTSTGVQRTAQIREHFTTRARRTPFQWRAASHTANYERHVCPRLADWRARLEHHRRKRPPHQSSQKSRTRPGDPVGLPRAIRLSWWELPDTSASRSAW